MPRSKLRPDERVNAAVYMSDLCLDICVNSIKDQNCKITEEELMKRVRERISFGRRRHREVQNLETFEQFVRRIVKSFNSAGIDYMFTGALAASYYGRPRTTMDADVIIRISSRDSSRSEFVSALKEAGVKVEERRIGMAFESRFKIATFRDSRSPFTLDAIFSGRRLNKRPGTILRLPTFYQIPEELILAKLRMIKATIPRERGFKDEEDVKAILKFTEVDLNALKRKAGRSNTLPILEDILM